MLRRSVPAALMLVCASGAAQAQQAAESGAARDRTGPVAQPPAPPPYARPAPGIPHAETADSPGTPAAASQPDVTFSELVVTTEPPGGEPARAKRDADAAAPGTAEPSVRFTAGEPLDADWVKRQFEANALIGRPVTLDRVVALVQLINLAYARNGYINSGVLVQGGAARANRPLALRLVLGHLVGGGEPVAVAFGSQADGGLDERYVRGRMPAAERSPLDATALERDFRLLAENPAIRTVNADLQPGSRPGEASLLLTVVPAPRADLYVSFANSRSPSIGGQRVAVGGSFRNVLAAGDDLTAETGLTAGHSDAVIGYETPYGDTATLLSLHGGFNNAAVVDAPLRPLDIRASDWNVEGGLSRRFLAVPLTPLANGAGYAQARSLTLGFSFAHRASRTSLLGQPFSFSPGSVGGRTEYTAFRLTADFEARGTREVIALSLTASQGVEGTLGDIPGIIRPDPHFRAVLMQGSYARRLDGAGLELCVRLTGQYADGVLYTGERLSAGGEYSVRGYRENLLLADIGLIGSIELARPFSITGKRGAGATDWGAFSISGFFDGAVLHNRRDDSAIVPSQQPSAAQIASVGVSLAWVPSDAILARVTYAKALKDASFPGSRDLQDRGFQFRVTIHPLRLLGGQR